MSVNIDYEGLIAKIGECCLDCAVCEHEDCLIGYCKKSLMTALKQNDDFIDDGLDGLPLDDTKIFQEEKIVDFIGFLLNQCRNCHIYHDEDCIVNIVRSALEVILFGEPQEYRGSNVKYLQTLNGVNQELAVRIMDAFQKHKKKEN
ncbi:MAG: hypothetical protein GX262_06375 [Clostridia bacterium]|nr:hypothetical protein [Clostridia bacterium]